MKKLLAGLAAAIGYLAVYFLITVLVVFVSGIIYSVNALFTAADIEGAPNGAMDRISQGLNNYINENTLLFMAVSGILSLFIYWLIIVIRKKSFKERLDLNGVPFNSIWPILPLGITLNIFISYLLDFLPIPEKVLEDYAQSSSFMAGDVTFVMILSVAIVAPVLEEILYRGLVMKSLERGMPKVVALILQALIFGVMHGQILWICYATVIGLIFGMLRLRYKSLLPSILLHFSFNASNFILLPLNSFIGQNLIASLAFFVVAAVLSFILMRVIYFKTKGFTMLVPDQSLTEPPAAE